MHLLSCYECITNHKHSIDNEVRQGIMTELIHQITDLCDSEHLSYDGARPVSVGPGIWMIQATEMSEECTKHGSCRQMPRFVVQLGDKLAFG